MFCLVVGFQTDCTGLPVEIVIGTGESVIRWLLMPRLGKIRANLPNVKLSFLNQPTTEIVRRLSDGLIDFGILRKDAVARPLQMTSLGSMAYALFFPTDVRPSGAGPERGMKCLDGIPLATLEGVGAFRQDLA